MLGGWTETLWLLVGVSGVLGGGKWIVGGCLCEGLWQSQLPAIDVSHSLGFLGIHFRQVRGNIFDKVASVMSKETSWGATSTIFLIISTQTRMPLVTISDGAAKLWILVISHKFPTELWMILWTFTLDLP